MLEQTLELGIQTRVVDDAVEVVPLRHPLDVEDDERDRERVLRQNSLSDGFGRSDNFARGSKRTEKVLPESLEEVDVLRLLGSEIQKCSNAGIVAVKHRPDVIQHEGQDKFFDQTEDV